MGNWLEVEEFAKTARLDVDSIDALVKKGELQQKEENGKRFVLADTPSHTHLPDIIEDIAVQGENVVVQSDFIEKTIGTILNLHEKVLQAKDETNDALREENTFLKEALVSMQELNDEDKKTIDTLREQLRMAKEEIEFLKRKYKLMWGKVVEEYSGDKK